MQYNVDIDEIARKLAGGMTLEQLRQKQGAAQYSTSMPEPAVPITEEGRRHLARVHGEPDPAPTVIVRNSGQSMKWDVARRKVWALFELRAAHISQIEDREFNWIFDEKDLEIIRNLIRYFINDPQCAWPLTKGLFLYGLPGTGKTEIMQVFERFCRENNLPKQFDFTSMSETYVRAKSEKGFDPITHNVQLCRCFDEFGLYTGAVMNFGESLDINEAIIEARYKRNRQSGQISHFITNSAPNQLETMFTPMIFDRLRSMCTSVYFEGQSKRK